MPKGHYPFIICTAPHQRDLLQRLPSALVAHLNNAPCSLSLNAASRLGGHLMAIGVTGEPTALAILRPVPEKRNSYTPSSAQSAASASRSNISPIVMPMSRM